MPPESSADLRAAFRDEAHWANGKASIGRWLGAESEFEFAGRPQSGEPWRQERTYNGLES